MANYNNLKSSINSSIRQNGNNAITGQILQSVLNSMVSALGAQYQIVGVASTNTNPGTPDYNVAYLAGPGTYSNFGNITVPNGTIAILRYNGSWIADTLTLPGGTTVAWTQIVQSGTRIAQITINGTPIDVYAPTGGGGGGGGGDSISWNQIQQSGTKIATVTINGVSTDIYVPNPGSVVSVNQVQATGTKIATITVNGTPTDIYAPNDGQVVTENIQPAFTAQNRYMSVQYDGEMVESFAGMYVAFYPIVYGNKYTINIPRCANEASYVLGYANTYGTDLLGSSVFQLQNTIGDYSAFSYVINSAENYTYLLVCYHQASGVPTVTREYTTGSENQRITALENDVADLQDDVEELQETVLGGSVQIVVNPTQVVANKYMSVQYDGEFIESSTGVSIAFYPNTPGSRFEISIPHASNEAGYSIAYANRVSDSLIGSEVFELQDTVGTNTAYSKTINATENYPYICVAYVAADGAPTVTRQGSGYRFALQTDFVALREKVNQSQRTVKMLCFGNSFTQDSVNYAPFIFKGLAPDVDLRICMAIIGGCPMAQHCANITGVSQTLDGVTYNPNTEYAYFIYENGSNAWTLQARADADTLIGLDDWDIITFQQNGYDNFRAYATYYEPFMGPTFKSLVSKVSKPIKIGWIFTHGSYADTPADCLDHWEGSRDNTQLVLQNTPASFLFPYGTAIQNLRTTNISVGAYGAGVLQADHAHLQEGIATLCASYSIVISLLKLAGKDWRGIMGEGTRPTLQWITSHNCDGANYATQDVVEGVTDANCYLAQFAAVAAEERPFVVTTIS